MKKFLFIFCLVVAFAGALALAAHADEINNIYLPFVNTGNRGERVQSCVYPAPGEPCQIPTWTPGPSPTPFVWPTIATRTPGPSPTWVTGPLPTVNWTPLPPDYTPGGW